EPYSDSSSSSTEVRSLCLVPTQGLSADPHTAQNRQSDDSPTHHWPCHERAMWRSIPPGTSTLAVPTLLRLAAANWKDQENSRLKVDCFFVCLKVQLGVCPPRSTAKPLNMEANYCCPQLGRGAQAGRGVMMVGECRAGWVSMMQWHPIPMVEGHFGRGRLAATWRSWHRG
ncbi:hypothetical protein KUCAC02_027590, partial [Chaenocephalus aceratus]